MEVILGQKAVIPKYGLGRVTKLPETGKFNYIGVTPYIAGYQMNFDSKNVQLVPIKFR